ncbi:MAG: DoxX family protein, partial [Candidatus Acidiferrales bacterium]
MNSILAPTQKVYGLLVRVASGLQSSFLAIVRLYWGWQIAQNGWGKLHNLAHVTEFFASLGLPAPGPTATFVATFEFVGGVLL